MPFERNVGLCRDMRTTLVPNCESWYEGTLVRIPRSKIETNSIGMRDKEYSLNKAPGTYRIFVLGDSFAFGLGVNNEEMFSEVLERELNGQYEGSFEVFNLAILGIGTDSEYSRLLQYWDYTPDVVILQYYWNDIIDCDIMETEIERRFGNANVSGLNGHNPIEDHINSLDKEERCACVTGYLRMIYNLTREAGIPILVYDLNTWEEFSCFADLKWDSLYYLRATDWGRKYRLSRKDDHLNAGGHEAVAEELLRVIQPLINSMGSPA